MSAIGRELPDVKHQFLVTRQWQSLVGSGQAGFVVTRLLAAVRACRKQILRGQAIDEKLESSKLFV
jgi:hypothetical protein